MERCSRCGALLPQGSQRCPLCHAHGVLGAQRRLDPPGQADAGADQEVGMPGAVPPGPFSVGLERWLARPGGRRQARAVLSLGLVVVLLAASIAAWLTFVHSIWGARLSGIDQIVFVGGQSHPVSNTSIGDCLTVVDPSGTISNCSYSITGKFPADPLTTFTPGQLYVMRPDGSGLRQVTNAPNASYLSPVWSPDGARIATFVVSSDASVAAKLELMDGDGANAQMIPSVSLLPGVLGQTGGQGDASFNRLIAWSPDGSQLMALLGARQFGLIQADGTNLRQFVGSKPVWSPDGRYLAYFVYDDTSASQGYAPQAAVKIEILDTQTSQTRQLDTVPPAGGQALAWSPDGRYLAYDTSEGSSGGSSSTDALMLVRPDGSNPSLIAQWDGSLIEQLAWSPDSRQIAVVAQTIIDVTPGGWQGGTPELWAVNVDGSNIRDLAASDSEQPSWSPGGKRLVFANPGDASLLVADTTAQPRPTAQPITPGMSLLFAPCWSPLGGL